MVRRLRDGDLCAVLRSTGIEPGALVFVHSALFQLGRIEGVPIEQIPARLYHSLRECIGDRGTVAVPTFNFGFCNGETFDRQHTPSEEMGAFSEYVRTLPDARRSIHPMQSMAAVGPLAHELADRHTPGAFDDRSSFDALLDYDAHIVLVGCGIDAVSLVHWAEQRAGVPYRYWKEFSGRYRDENRIGRQTFRMYVRDLDRNPQLDLQPVARRLRRRGELRRFRAGQGAVESCRARHFAAEALKLLRRDPTALIRPSHPPDRAGRSHATR